MSSYQESLALLFKAEEEANRMIAEAESKKQVIMEEAIAESNQKLANHRKDLEAQYKKNSNANQNNFDALLKEANNTKIYNETEYRANKAKVVDLLMERIFNVGIELPKNVKGDFHKQFKKNK